MTKIQVRRGTAAEWNAKSPSPVLSPGEIGFETDTGKFKIGVAAGTNWASLPYAKSGAPTVLESALTFGTNLVIPGTPPVENGVFDGTSAVTVRLANPVVADLTGTADEALALSTARNINGTSFDGSANVSVPGAIFGNTVSVDGTFRNVYVTQSEPSAINVQNGDVWISW